MSSKGLVNGVKEGGRFGQQRLFILEDLGGFLLSLRGLLLICYDARSGGRRGV